MKGAKGDQTETNHAPCSTILPTNDTIQSKVNVREVEGERRRGKGGKKKMEEDVFSVQRSYQFIDSSDSPQLGRRCEPKQCSEAK